jgi:hypothetical protein
MTAGSPVRPEFTGTSNPRNTVLPDFRARRAPILRLLLGKGTDPYADLAVVLRATGSRFKADASSWFAGIQCAAPILPRPDPCH